MSRPYMIRLKDRTCLLPSYRFDRFYQALLMVSRGLGPVFLKATVHTVEPCFPPKVKAG